LSGDVFVNPARLFESFAPFSGLLLAVSGGPDSMALLHLAAAWRDAASASPRLYAATVNHGLRAGAAAEAAQVAGWCRALGVAHKTLVWTGEKPDAGVQARARVARYRLLFAHMREIEATAVATAHHADDQWETVMMRLARGSGIAGLAGMARDQEIFGGRLIRPLLDLPKAALTDHCRQCGQNFFEDPSNDDPRFARANWRAVAAPLHRLGLTPTRVSRLAERAEKCDRALQWAAARFLEQARIPTESHVYDFSNAGQAPAAIVEYFLQLALARVAGESAPRLVRAERLAGKLTAALRAEATCFATLGGCTVALTRDGRLKIEREPPRRRGL